MTDDAYVPVSLTEVARAGERWAQLTANPESYMADLEAELVEVAEGLASPIEFLESPRYLKMKGVLFPRNLEAYEEICLRGKPETILTGAIGWGKNTTAVPTLLYFIYQLSMQPDPHAWLGLKDRSSEILCVFQSDTFTNANKIGYARFRRACEMSPYFTGVFPFNPKLKSSTVFPNGIEVVPVAGDGGGIRGKNVVWAMIDEVAYMEVVEKSVKGAARPDGKFDQAEMLYATVARRRISRFLQGDRMPGQLFLVSSANTRGGFLEKKIAEAKEHPDQIALYDRRIWEVDPDRYKGLPTFRVFVGDDLRNPRVLEPDEPVREGDEELIADVPDHPAIRAQFEEDPFGATRDFIGSPTNATMPFLARDDLVNACFGHHDSIFEADETDFRAQLDVRLPYALAREPHHAHIDLGLTQDHAGLALGCVVGFVDVKREDTVETLPLIYVSALLEIKPAPGKEIDFGRIRAVVYGLREKCGINIQWVSYDSWQSVESRQQLRHQRFRTQVISMDETTDPYDMTKRALYDGRVRAPAHARAQRELARLQRVTKNPKRPKIDHPPNGSKDCADALAGLVWGLTRKREIWARHKIPARAIPSSVFRSSGSEQQEQKPEESTRDSRVGRDSGMGV